MLKNTYSFLILLLFAYFISKTAADIVASPQNTEMERFLKVVEYVKKDIQYRLLDSRRSFINLPATISNEDGKVSKFINLFIDNAGDLDSLKIKLQYHLYTPENPHDKFLLQLSYDSFHKSKFNSSLETKFLIHGYNEVLPKTSIIYNIKNQLLLKGNYNIIVVDWAIYSRAEYDSAAINAAFIGYEISKLIKLLIFYKGVSSQSIHLIGHSLGCHIAGHAGKVTPNLGRITSLDATGLLFDDLPSSLKITNTDAEFVDAIHTHGSSSETEGLGTFLPYGDIDFYPNGGSLQPGCRYGNIYMDANKNMRFLNAPLDFIFCNHQRALFLFLESINGCRFDSVMCYSYVDFKKGKCPRETSVVSRMGFYAAKSESLPPNTPFYLETNEKYPFCFENV